MFDFKPRTSELDYRSEFANYCCDLLVAKHDKYITETLADVGPLYNHFYNHVRNVYELIDREIPLFALFDLMQNGAANYGMTEAEYEEAKLKTLRACHRYYKFDLGGIIEWEKKNLK